MIWVWLAVLAAAVIVELVTPTALVSIWFAAGALAAVIFTILHAPFWLQIAVFVLVSLLLLALVRPAATRYLRGNVVATNADRYIGAIAVVEQTITTARWGIVKVEGSSWSAASYEGERIEKGSRVKIVAIEGVDGISIGPFDLSIALGIPGRFDDPRHIAAVERVRLACERANKPCIMFCGSAEAAAGYFAQGFTSVTVSLDISILIDAAKAMSDTAFGK